jgi:quercetin dioxygenase-like cupin family protein
LRVVDTSPVQKTAKFSRNSAKTSLKSPPNTHMTLLADSPVAIDSPEGALETRDASLPQSIVDLPAQRAASPATAAQARALYFNTGNAFNQKVTEVPDESFTDEPAWALNFDSPTGLTACDRSQQLGTAYPATTPLVLARYARILAGDSLRTEFVASGVVMYVIVGSGSTTCGQEQINWAPGDVVVLPGSVPHLHRASAVDAVLWIVTNEPQLAFEHLRGPAKGDAPTDLVHFPAQEIERQIDLLYKIGRGNDIAGSALIFSSTRQEASRIVLPTLMAAMNSLPPGGSQRAHRHNSVAVSLVISGEQCHSMVDGRRKDWAPWATTVTPPTAAHSHYNGGETWARFLIIQDGGLYSYTRALGFEFANA